MPVEPGTPTKNLPRKETLIDGDNWFTMKSKSKPQRKVDPLLEKLPNTKMPQ